MAYDLDMSIKGEWPDFYKTCFWSENVEKFEIKGGREIKWMAMPISLENFRIAKRLLISSFIQNREEKKHEYEI